MIDNFSETRPERRVYRYPAHLKSKPKLWLWSLRDLAVLGCMLPFSVLLAVWIRGALGTPGGGRRIRSRPADPPVLNEAENLRLEDARYRFLI